MNCSKIKEPICRNFFLDPLTLPPDGLSLRSLEKRIFLVEFYSFVFLIILMILFRSPLTSEVYLGPL